MPFEWRYSFVPILTSEALELLEAPGTFMMGCHSVHIKEVEQVKSYLLSVISVCLQWGKWVCCNWSLCFINNPESLMFVK